jgi:hypothetical protein
MFFFCKKRTKKTFTLEAALRAAMTERRNAHQGAKVFGAPFFKKAHSFFFLGYS